jgi:hypothetical protein
MPGSRKKPKKRRERKNIETTLDLVKARKKKFIVAAAAAEETVDAAVTNQNPEQAAAEHASCQQEFWQILENENQESMTLFLRLFEPTSGKLSKAKPQQWPFLQSKISPRLTKSTYIAKVEEYVRRLSAIEDELNELKEGEDNIDIDNVL